MRAIAVRLQPGSDLKSEIDKLARSKNIEAGIILSGVGGLSATKIRVPVVNHEVKYIEPTNVEIVSLDGTVSKNGGHIHISVSDTDGKTWGGHIKEGCIVRTTCELVVGILDGIKFTREPDSETGYDELVVST